MLITVACSYAQNATVSAGGDAKSSSGSISYSIGQTAYTSDEGNNGSQLKGVQQAYEIYAITGIKNTLADQLTISIGPNPTSDAINIKIEEQVSKQLTYSLFAVNGELLKSGQLLSQSSVLDLKHLASAVYLLQIANTSNQQQTFQILKK